MIIQNIPSTFKGVIVGFFSKKHQKLYLFRIFNNEVVAYCAFSIKIKIFQKISFSYRRVI